MPGPHTQVRAAVGIMLLAAVPSRAWAGSLEVQVMLRPAPDVQTPAEHAVVWLEGTGRGAPVSREIHQHRKQFEPPVTIVPVGSTVGFPNRDQVEHNVFSLSQIKPFDLGLFGRGRSRSVRFEKPGLVQVYCNIHPEMLAYVWVVESSFYARTRRDGTITFRSVPDGPRRLRVWHEMAGEAVRDVKISGDAQVLVTLDVSGWAPMPHLNKFGETYRGKGALY